MAASTVRVQFNPVFRSANESHHRYRVMKGSAGSGKSVNVAQDYVLKLSDPKFRGANLLVIRKVDATNRYSTYAELSAVVYRIFGDQWQRYWRIRQNPLELESRITGGKIIFRGMKDDREREKIKSINFERGKLTWIWCEEATELNERDIDILDDRLRGVLPNPNLFYQITMTFNRSARCTGSSAAISMLCIPKFSRITARIWTTGLSMRRITAA
jgi:phage terminase large subunit